MRSRKCFVFFVFLAGCSATPEDPDPHKEFNKSGMALNLALDRNVLKPAAEVYKETPDTMQLVVSNVLDNLREPFYFVNYGLRVDAENMIASLLRFVINSTIGFLGFFDVAAELGIPKTTTGYKETLKTIEVPQGDYLVLPVFGSSSTRDTIAEPISWFADPVSYVIGWPWSIATAVLRTISDRAQNYEALNAATNNSEDVVYQTARSFYLQKYGVNNKVSPGENEAKDEGPSPDDEEEEL